MSNSVHHPHDSLVKAVLSDPQEAAEFLRLHIPAALADRIDWQTLRLVNTTYVDEDLAGQESDLLYQVQLRDDKETMLIYVLFEHQSEPQRWMRFRLLKYYTHIWDDSFKEYPEQKGLPPILSLVFYQGKAAWSYSTEFADLFPESARGWNSIPRFSHVLIDQSDLDPAATAGGLRARVMQLLMYAAFHEPVQEALNLAARLLAHVQESGGVNYVRVFVRYVFATQERRTVAEFARTVDVLMPERGEKVMTFAEELLREGELRGEKRGEQKGEQRGEQRGEIKGEIKTIAELLRVGVTWETIERATGIDPQRFEEMQKELARLAAADSGGSFSSDLPKG